MFERTWKKILREACPDQRELPVEYQCSRPQNHPYFGRERNRFTFNLPYFLHEVWTKVIISDSNLKESDLFMAWGLAWQEMGEKRNSVHIPRPESYPALRTRLIGFSPKAGFPEPALKSQSRQDSSGLGQEAKDPSTWLPWADHRLQSASLFWLLQAA